MDFVLSFAILFMLGSVGGWVAELFFRRFTSKQKHWINPGFLSGPCLPIYGFGVSAMYFFTRFIERVDLPGSFTYEQSFYIKGIIVTAAMAVIMTLTELIAGEIFIIKMKIRLWDYSKNKFNYKGVICLKFSLIWALCGAVYYYFVDYFLWYIIDYTKRQDYVLFILGVFYGVLVVDLFYSFSVVAKIREFAVENKIVVFYDDFKQNIDASRRAKKEKTEFAFVFRGNLQQYLKEYSEKLRENTEQFVTKMQENTEQIKSKVQENTEQLKNKVQENTEQLKTKVQENTEQLKTKMHEAGDKHKSKK